MGANTDVIKRVDCMYKSVPAKRAPARAHIAAFIVRRPATFRMAPRDGGLGGGKGGGHFKNYDRGVPPGF